jgi:uncharacterized protein Smg (DUF494 family)
MAYRGVVLLFNAVRQQQKNLECQLKEAGSSERKRDKVMKSLDKRAFIDILMGSSCSEPVDSPVKLEAEMKVRWAQTQTCSLKVECKGFFIFLDYVAEGGGTAPYMACPA